MWKITKREKMLTRYPGVLIGRLVVTEEFGGIGIGSAVLRFIGVKELDIICLVSPFLIGPCKLT